MRWDKFWECIQGYKFDTVIRLATEKIFKGGWEGWFQVELAKYLYDKGGNFEIYREEQYYNTAKRSDFLIRYKGGRDPTYIELKCINPWNESDAQSKVLNQYANDITKALQEPTMNIGCMLIYAVNSEEELRAAIGIIVSQAGDGESGVHCEYLGKNGNETEVYIIYCEPRKPLLY